MSADVVVFVVPVGEFDACVQKTRERVDAEELLVDVSGTIRRTRSSMAHRVG